MLSSDPKFKRRRIKFLWWCAFGALTLFVVAIAILGERLRIPINAWIFPERTSATISPNAECTSHWMSFCFVDGAEALSNSFFGFAEFMTALALLVVLYTISDVRYRFRVSVTPFPIFGATYFLLGTVGFGSLFVDLAFAAKWQVPSFLPTQAVLQSIFGGVFLAVSLVWIFYGFIQPPKYGRYNYKKYASVLYGFILRGSEQELPIVAAELSRSAERLVGFAASKSYTARDSQHTKPGPAEYAHDIALLIASRKFCRHVVASAPGTAVAIFDAISRGGIYHLPFSQFGVNLATEAILNKDSPLYHEDDGYHSGLIGYLRPFSNALFGNFELVEALGQNGNSPLDIDYRVVFSWDAAQFEAFTRALLITLKSYVDRGYSTHSYALHRALGDVKTSSSDIYKIEQISTDAYSSDPYRRFKVAAEFIKDAIKLLDKKRPLLRYRLRVSQDQKLLHATIYDDIAGLLFDMMLSATSVKTDPDVSWSIQYGTIWSTIFAGYHEGPAWKIVQHKLRRLLYDEIRRFDKFVNYKSARALAICLNVMGLTLHEKKGFGSEYYALHKAVLEWTRRNFFKVYSQNSDVAEACLTGGISFDEQQRRLVKTFAKNLSREAPKHYLNLESDLNTPAPKPLTKSGHFKRMLERRP